MVFCSFVIKVTSYRPDSSLQDQRFFSFLPYSDKLWGSTNFLCSGYQVPSLGEKQPQKTTCMHLHLHGMVLKHRDNFCQELHHILISLRLLVIHMLFYHFFLKFLLFHRFLYVYKHTKCYSL
jgi:hypothetical protein